MNEKNENKTMPVSNEVAFYELMKDSYNQRYKIRALIFKRVLKHMLKKTNEEITIFILMNEIMAYKKTEQLTQCSSKTFKY